MSKVGIVAEISEGPPVYKDVDPSNLPFTFGQYITAGVEFLPSSGRERLGGATFAKIKVRSLRFGWIKRVTI